MGKKITRRQFWQVTGASAAALLLASCAGNSASSVNSSSVASSAASSSETASSTVVSLETVTSVSSTGKTLVVYYTNTGNTETAAQLIADTVGADLFAVETAEPYTSEDLNYTDENSRVSREHNDESLRNVELATPAVDGWENYDTAFIGYPIWWGIAAWPMSSFVAANDFTGKTVIPFCTAYSSSIGQSGELLADLAGTGDWLSGRRIETSETESDIAAWIAELGL